MRVKQGMIAFLTVLAAAAVLVAGCGGDDDGEAALAETSAATTAPEETAAATTAPAETAADTAAAGETTAETAASEEPVTVRLALTGGFGTLPVRIAQENGIFEEHGLDVQTTEGTELAAWMGAVGEQWDVVMSLPPILLAATCAGADVRVISNMQHTDDEHLNSVLVTKDPSIQSIADLRGKRIGVPTLTGGSAESTRFLLAQEGISEDEVMFVEVPFATAGDQMNAGRIDATVSAIPFYTTLEQQGFRVLPFDVILEAARAASGEPLDRTTTVFFVTTAEYPDQNPEVVEAFRQSLQEAIDYIEANDAEARQELQEWLELPPEIAESAPFPGISVDISAEELQPFVEVSSSLGSIPCEPNVEPLVWTEAS